jgi:hypothetical protein
MTRPAVIGFRFIERVCLVDIVRGCRVGWEVDDLNHHQVYEPRYEKKRTKIYSHLDITFLVSSNKRGGEIRKENIAIFR